MPKKKTVSNTPKRVPARIDEPFHSVRRKRTKYVKKGRRIYFDDRCPSPELEPQPSTSSAAEPIEYASFVTPENLKRYSGAPPGTPAWLQYKRSSRGHWTFHKKLSQYALNSYKYSPNYILWKNKRFNNPSFLNNTREDLRDLQIFTPEEENDPNAWWNNMPKYGEKYSNMTDQAPGEKYKDVFYTGIFAKMPSVLEDDDYKRFLKKEAKMKKEEVREIVNVRRRRSNIGRPVLSRKRRGPLPDESVNFDWDSLGPDFFLPSESEDEEEENQKKKKGKITKKSAASKRSLGKNAKDIDGPLNQSQDSIKKKTRGKSEVALKRLKGKASVENLSGVDMKNLKRKPVRKVPAKTAKRRKCIDIDSDEEAVSSDYSLSSIDFKPTDPAVISYNTDCVKRNQELDKMEEEALKNQRRARKNLERKPVRKVPAKTAKRRKCIDIVSGDEAVFSEDSLSSITFKTTDAAVISGYKDCLKGSREIAKNEGKALKKRGRPSKNPEEYKSASESKPLLDDLLMCRKKSHKSASDVEVKNQKAKDKKAPTQKRGKQREVVKNEGKALKKRGRPSKNPKEYKSASESKPLLDDLLLCGKKSHKPASDVEVKNQKAKDKKAPTQKRGKSEESSPQKRKYGLIKTKSGGSKVVMKSVKAKSNEKIHSGPLTSTMASRSLMKSDNKLATNSQNNSINAEDQNIGDPIPCSILLNLLKSPPPKVSSASSEEFENKSSIAGSDRGKKLPRVGEKATNLNDAAISEVKLLPDERIIGNRVLRIFLNKG